MRFHQSLEPRGHSEDRISKTPNNQLRQTPAKQPDSTERGEERFPNGWLKSVQSVPSSTVSRPIPWGFGFQDCLFLAGSFFDLACRKEGFWQTALA
ncbi:MAG: hypothetical protein M2R45_02545 [Verrucomicrobia subdivision 3 bacterium]|nr:hypothetical protein [Limisphaerales bacterium]MCS1414247.1 hypothetical protein [Limisphaerales bacterium]